MENNIEDIIRKNFRKREIAPSDSSFETLSTNLDTHSKKKRKKLIRFFAYAASIIGLIFSIQFAFQKNKEDKNQIITNVNIDDSTTVAPLNGAKKLLKIEREEKLVKSNYKKKLLNTTPTQKETLLVKLEENFSKNDSVAIAIEKPQVEQFVDKNQFKDIFFIQDISDAELDALLATARQSLPKNKGDSIVINAKTMLYELEVEINKPLPEKVYLTLKTGASTIKKIVKPSDNK